MIAREGAAPVVPADASRPGGAAAPGALLDAQGRRIAYLRLSLTDRCNFRCSYCAPAGPDRSGDPLARAELARLVRIFAAAGVRRVRLTGGEPTLRPDLLEIVADVRATPGIEEVALTTNGHALATLARPLRAAGVSRLNVSLDTLDPERLRRISGRAASLERIVAGLEAALGAGFESVKLNVVVVRGENDDELGALTRFAWRLGATPRFIELMPFGAGRPVPDRGGEGAARGAGDRAHRRRGARVGARAPHARHVLGRRRAPHRARRVHRRDDRGLLRRVQPRARRRGRRAARLPGRARSGLRSRSRCGRGRPTRSSTALIRGALLAKRDRHHMADDAGRLLPMIGTGG